MRANSVLPVIAVAIATVLLPQTLVTAADETAPRLRVTDPSLLFTELVLKPGENGTRTLRLVRATFRNGKLTDREELYTDDASEFGYQSQYHLVDDRYVVFHSATVFDLVGKKVVHSFDGGQVLSVEGPLVYFYSNKTSGEQGVFCFNTTTGKQERVADLGEGRWGLRGTVSPNGTKAIVRELKNVARLEGDEMPYTIVMDQLGKPRESLGEFAATCGTTGGGSIPDYPPGVWLDDDRFITQTTLGKVVVLHTAEKKQEQVVDIPPTHKPREESWDSSGAIGFTPLGLQQPQFTLLSDGRVMYEADEVYFIDVGKKTWEKTDWRPLGHGFHYALRHKIGEADQFTRSLTTWLRHDGKVIGASQSVWWMTVTKSRVATTDGYLAVIERVPQPGKKVPADAVRVWSAATGQWQTINGWLDSLVGWVISTIPTSSA